MMRPPADEALADVLAKLRTENRQQSGLDAALVPSDADAAYRIAGKVAEKLPWKVAGWKIAALKEDMQRALRTSAPIYGRVFEPFVRPSPAVFEGRALLRPLSEVEFAVKLGLDLPPRSEPYGEPEVVEAIQSIHPGIEIAECRFVHDESFPPLPAILADGSGSGSIVYGAAIDDWWRKDIAAQQATLWVNGVAKRMGRAADAINHPVASVTWLANELSRKGIGMKSGQIVSTGTLTGMVLARPGDEHTADYGPLGKVSVKFATDQTERRNGR